MKFYVLKLDSENYLAGNSKNKHFVKTIEKARKFNRKSDATNCRNTTYYSDLIKSCQVVEIDVFGYAILEEKQHSFEMDYGKMRKYEL